MNFIALAALVLSALSISASPATSDIDDTVVLNYALTLEHLENAFYSGALSRFDEKAFKAAGLPSWARGRFVQIGEHEAAHVKFLSTALGDKATQPCTYNFPYDDPKSFAALSQVLEGVGVSAYAGAAKFITNKDYLTAAAVVLSTEARHASFVASAVNKGNGWSGALDTPLSLDQVYTLAASFITGCPSTNPPLPVKAFPALTIGKGKPGATVDVECDGSNAPSYIAFFTGLAQEFAPVTNGKVMIPSDLTGTVYAVGTSSNNSATDDNIVSGPAILQFLFDSQGHPL